MEIECYEQRLIAHIKNFNKIWLLGLQSSSKFDVFAKCLFKLGNLLNKSGIDDTILNKIPISEFKKIGISRLLHDIFIENKETDTINITKIIEKHANTIMKHKISTEIINLIQCLNGNFDIIGLSHPTFIKNIEFRNIDQTTNIANHMFQIYFDEIKRTQTTPSITLSCDANDKDASSSINRTIRKKFKSSVMVLNTTNINKIQNNMRNLSTSSLNDKYIKYYLNSNEQYHCPDGQSLFRLKNKFNETFVKTIAISNILHFNNTKELNYYGELIV